jgi:hypothetical protein
MKRLVAIRFISASCIVLAAVVLLFDIANHKHGFGDGHGYFITTMLLITSALELVRSELTDLRKKLDEKP